MLYKSVYRRRPRTAMSGWQPIPHTSQIHITGGHISQLILFFLDLQMKIKLHTEIKKKMRVIPEESRSLWANFSDLYQHKIRSQLPRDVRIICFALQAKPDKTTKTQTKKSKWQGIWQRKTYPSVLGWGETRPRNPLVQARRSCHPIELSQGIIFVVTSIGIP